MKTFLFCREDLTQNVLFLHPCVALRASSFRMAVQIFALKSKMKVKAIGAVGKETTRIQLTKRHWFGTEEQIHFIVAHKKEKEKQAVGWLQQDKKIGI